MLSCLRMNLSRVFGHPILFESNSGMFFMMNPVHRRIRLECRFPDRLWITLYRWCTFQNHHISEASHYRKLPLEFDRDLSKPVQAEQQSSCVNHHVVLIPYF